MSYLLMRASPLTECPKGLQGVWFARRSSKGIWYFVRDISKAHEFSTPGMEGEALMAAEDLGAHRAGEMMIGFVIKPQARPKKTMS